ncbi:MAG: hypothetical protein L7S72_09300, partial [Flavobacteriales bacterium]|nr:hypothetical protein [Flavobacteriales bacterium]
IKYSFNGINWLISSKEHTNFSFKLNNSQIQTVSYVISNFYKIDYKNVVKDINYIQNLTIENAFKNIFKTIDLDFSPKWDYRAIPYILTKYKKIHYVFEFGTDQGRIGYLLNNLQSKYPSSSFEYKGIENNKRKGILLLNNAFQNIDIIFDNLQSCLPKISVNKLMDSLIISSTHEIDSEKFLFDYLDSKNILPKYIISDECSENSEYSKFVTNHGYTSTVIPFEDPNNFLDTTYIGIAKLNNF